MDEEIMPEDKEQQYAPELEEEQRRIDRREFLWLSARAVAGASIGVFSFFTFSHKLNASICCDSDCVQCSCEGHCGSHCGIDCDCNCESHHTHSWKDDHWEPVSGQASQYHHMIQKCQGCGATRVKPGSKGPHTWQHTGYAQYNASHHYKNFRCPTCGYLRQDLEHHFPHALSINDAQAIATITCACNATETRPLPSFFVSLKSGSGNMNPYSDFIDASIFAQDTPDAPLHDSQSSFVYRTLKDSSDNPYLYVPEKGRLSLSLRKGDIDAHLNSMYILEAFGQVLTPSQFSALSEYDRLYYLKDGTYELVYERNRSGWSEVKPLMAGGLTILDDFDYNQEKTLQFKEENRNGLTRFYTMHYMFSNIYPSLSISAQGNEGRSLEDAGETSSSLATRNNTVYSKFHPHFNLSFTCNKGVLGAHDWVLNPLGERADYELYRQENNTWVDVSSDASMNTYKGPFNALMFSLEPVVGSDTIVQEVSARGYNVNLLSKYALTVKARNIIGNLSSKSFYFYLDDGVEIDPRIIWMYLLPTVAINDPNQRVLGKHTIEEIDFDTLNQDRENHHIVTVNVYDDKGYLAEEGYRGPVQGAVPNDSGLFFLKDTDAPSEPGNLIPSSSSSLKKDADKKDYFPIRLTFKNFLEQNAVPGDRVYKSRDLKIERVVQNAAGAEQYIQRTIAVPTNVWNIPFRAKILCRDWIGNEKAVDASVVSGTGFQLSLKNNSIYTPAYCPDLDITTVYISGKNNEVLTNPDLAIHPPVGTLLEATLLPTLRAFSAEYRVQVEDNNGQVVFPQAGQNDLFDTKGGAVHLKDLGYGSLYHFYVSAVNANGYTTEPQNLFRYTFTKDDLIINRSGVLGADEVWNWRYRLIGDVIIPHEIKLSIIPGGLVTMPKLPAVFADRKAKIIVKSGGALVIDGGLGFKNNDSFHPADHYLNKDEFVNLLPSGLDTRLNNGSSPETIYKFDGENNWGGIYFEGGYDKGSYIRRARICGAYDGILVFGGGNDSKHLEVEKSLILANYIGVHALSSSALRIADAVIDSNLEYGLKTEGRHYRIVLEDISRCGQPNRYADYYSTKLYRKLSFEDLLHNAEIRQGEKGENQ